MSSLTGLLIVNGYLKSSKFDELYSMLKTAAIDNEINLELKTNDRILASLSPKNELQKYDFCLFWDKDIMLAKYIEANNIRVFNNSRAIEICDDKAKTHIALFNSNIKMPKTIIAPMTYSNIGYTNLNFLDEVEEALSYPIVIKERVGSFGMQVYLAKNKNELIQITKEHACMGLIFQEFIHTPKLNDIRINMVGTKACCTMERFAKTGDFRSNITNGGTMNIYTPTKEQIHICQEVMKTLSLDYAGIDLLQDELGNNYVCEVNSNAHFKNIYDCTKVNCAIELMKYIKETLLHNV